MSHLRLRARPKRRKRPPRLTWRQWSAQFEGAWREVEGVWVKAIDDHVAKLVIEGREHVITGVTVDRTQDLLTTQTLTMRYTTRAISLPFSAGDVAHGLLGGIR